jgi:membrane AbrB-like protein
LRFTFRTALVLVGGILLALIFRATHLPGAWLFGPLTVSAIFGVRGWESVRLPNSVYIAGQAVIGTALGAGFSPKTLGLVPQHLVVFSFAVIFILLTSLLNGWLLARFTRLDAATAFLGIMPGGASAMAAMSDSLKADTRLVTSLQLVRLLIVLATLALAAPWLNHLSQSSGATGPAETLAPVIPFAWWRFGILVGLTLVGWLVGMNTRIPAGSFLIPIFLYFLVSLSGISLGGWPWPLLAAAYLAMGVQIGGRFDPGTVRLVRSVILPVVGTTLLLLTASVVLAWVVAREMHLSFVSAYLAATPGGLDSVAAVATELHIDTTVVVTMHMVRLLCVLLFGPWLVRACVSRYGEKELGIGRDAPSFLPEREEIRFAEERTETTGPGGR